MKIDDSQPLTGVVGRLSCLPAGQDIPSMNRIPHFLFAALLLAAPVRTVTAEESIQLARTPDISPDGKLVAFSYLGDIWVVDAAGGVARPVTIHRAHEMNPVFS